MSSYQNFFVTGIGTGIGKTVTSAVLCTALDADYWKPIQAGDLQKSDSVFIKKHATLDKGTIHNEAYALKYALAPHKAAQIENIEISLDELVLPKTNNHCIIEGAGGCAVPLNGEYTFQDFAAINKLPTIVVVKNYLGSINHTLLTLWALKQRGVQVLGIILVGTENNSSQEAYQVHSGVKILGRVDWAAKIDSKFIAEQAEKLKKSLSQQLFAND